ncbi:MAG: hypothetical protein JNM47_16325 [Hyphomonadaceae bacterium]|nr:hypothetical protein [Hyphomonadaceae bacterium]
MDAYYFGLVIFLTAGAPFFLALGYFSKELGGWMERRRLRAIGRRPANDR